MKTQPCRFRGLVQAVPEIFGNQMYVLMTFKDSDNVERAAPVIIVDDTAWGQVALSRGTLQRLGLRRSKRLALLRRRQDRGHAQSHV
ncbi:hypothetical protein ISCGN_030290 [Ixodes scapularis]